MVIIYRHQNRHSHRHRHSQRHHRLPSSLYLVIGFIVVHSLPSGFQITSLSSLGLLSTVAGGDQIDSPKYKCLVNLDFIKGISRSVLAAILISENCSS